MNRRFLDRRRFLKLVGATAFTYPFLRGVPSFAAGSSPVSPYLVLLFSGCGVVRYKWGAQGPAATGMTDAVTTPLVFRDTLSAFAAAGPMKVDLSKWVTVLDGLSNRAAQSGTHEVGMATLWTATTAVGQSPTGPSFDQAIAPLLAQQLNIQRAYPTIPLMAQSSQDYPERGVDTRMLYDATANWVDPYSAPATALSTLFPSAIATSTGPDKKTFIRQKVAAQINGDLTALQSRLCTEDRIQLQTLQDIYNSVLAQILAAATASASCSAPSMSSSATAAGADPFPANVTAMSNILAMALACDLTRVASLQLSHALSPVTHTWIPSVAMAPQSHHQFSHIGPSWMGALGDDLYNEPASVTSQYPQQLIDIDAWYATQFANFAYTLSQLKSGIGSGTLLDQTVACWGSEIDMGAAHNHDDQPFVLLGTGGGKLKGNQLVRFPLLTGNAAQSNMAGSRFHNDLLITLAKVMGVTLPGNTFGTASLCTGPITEILA